MTHKWEKCWCSVHLLHIENKWVDLYKTAYQRIYSQHCHKFIYFHYISHVTSRWWLKFTNCHLIPQISLIQYTSNISLYFQVAFWWHFCKKDVTSVATINRLMDINNKICSHLLNCINHTSFSLIVVWHGNLFYMYMNT